MGLCGNEQRLLTEQVANNILKLISIKTKAVGQAGAYLRGLWAFVVENNEGKVEKD